MYCNQSGETPAAPCGGTAPSSPIGLGLARGLGLERLKKAYVVTQ